MELITLPRLRHAQLQTLTESTLKVCEGIPEVEPATKKVEDTLSAFKKGKLKARTSADEKQLLDTTRDKLISGFVMAVRAEQQFPHEEGDESVRQTLKTLSKIVLEHGASINRLPQNEESAAIDNLLSEVKKVSLSALENTGLPRWIPHIENANESFKQEANEYVSETADAAEIEAATILAPQLRDALEGLFTMLFAHVKISDSETLAKAYTELEVLVDTYR